jgi:Domain of unknown function (DUF4388)
MHGSLSSVPLPEILRVIYNERRSGELIVRRATESATIEKHVYFERGQVVFASSSQPEDRIGETLLRYNKLSREQLEQFFSQLPPGQRLGKALVDSGVLSDRELVNYVTLQFIDIIYSIFTWKDGSYQFSSGENNAPDELKLKFSTPTIILEGMRRVNDFELVRRGIGSPAKALHTTSAGRSKIQAIAFNPLELNLMNMAKEPIDLLRVLVNCKERPEKVLQSIYSLLVIGMLEQIDEAQPTSNVEVAQQHIPLFAGTDVTTADVETMRSRIISRDPRVILGVQPQNNINEVYDVYLKLATKFHPDKFVNAPKQLKAELELIFNAINESYNFIRTAPVAPAPAVMAPQNMPQTPNYGAPNSGYLSQQPMQHSNSAYPPQPMQPMQNPSMPLPNTRLQTGTFRNPWQTGAIPQAQVPPTGGYATPQQGGYYPQQSNPAINPLAQLQATKRSSITRAVSDELEYRGEKDKNPFSALQKKNLDVNQAISELLDYFDDRRAPLFTSDALSKLLRTKPPTHISQKELVETIINWARNKSAVMGWPIPIILLRVITLIKQAETSQLIEDFDGAAFYPGFIQELTNYCMPPEAEEFIRGLSSL